MSRNRVVFRMTFVVVALLMLPIGSISAQECPFLTSDALDEAFPDQAPWRTISGGVGACQFMGGRLPNMFSVTQMVKASKEDAASYVSNLRKSTAESYEVVDVPQLGDGAFYYRPGAEMDPTGRSMFLVGHRDRVAVMSSIAFQGALTDRELEAAIPLIQSALAIAGDEKALASATSCPWFESTVLEKLFGGESYEENVFGENSCMAYVGSKVLMVRVVEADDPEQVLGAMSDASCESEALSAMGEGMVQFACSSGNPRASVRMALPASVIDFSYAPGVEPTEEERSYLIDLARLAALRAGN